MEGATTEKQKGFFSKLKDAAEDQEHQIQILGTFVRLGVVVVVLCIEPCVKLGVTNSALATVGDINRKNKNHFFITFVFRYRFSCYYHYQ